MKKTHITIILDRSGSMADIADDTIGGFNTFLGKQQVEPGIATMTLVQFDSQDPYEVIHCFKPISDVPALTKETFVPRSKTPLLDAIGKGILDLERSLGEIKLKDQPSAIIFVVLTDGKENDSHEFSKAKVVEMIKAHPDWQFVFLSADLDAMADARGVGIHEQSSLAFNRSAQGCKEVFDALSERTSDVRANRRGRVEFEQTDRKHAQDPHKTK
jgi:hypothetical protein